MANRPVFVVSLDNKFCIRENTDFEFFSGFQINKKRGVYAACIKNI